jgi:dipeptidyl aminopeptidase/acylaminoacyl peptidase
MRIIATLLLLSLLGACSSMDGSTVRKIPLRDFFKNSTIRTFRISPDGQKIAALKPYKNRMNVFVKDINGTEWQRLTSQTDRDIPYIFWKGSNHVLYVRDFGGDENFHLFSTNVTTKKDRNLTPFKGVKVRVLDGLKGISKTDMLITMNKRDRRFFDVYRINVESGNMSLEAKNPGYYLGWLTDHNGKIRIAYGSQGTNTSLYYRGARGGSFKKIITTNFKQSLSPIFFDFNNKNVYALSNLKSDTKRLVLMNPRNAKVLKTIYSNKNYDVTGVSYSRKLKEMTYASYQDAKVRKTYFSKYYKNIMMDIEKKVPGKEIMLTSSNDDENFFTVYAGSDRSKGMYYLYDAKSKSLSFLANPSPWINENEMAQMKPIKYKSRDGLTIEGYLTLPKGKESAKGLPMVVNPHGGPWHRDSWGYNPEVQFLANRGYAVLQVNFRGSTGFGRKFWEASFKQWGLKMQDDITDGVNWVVEQGIVDPKRICIYGASYGGYATLAGLTYTPDLYRCGVDYVGVSNLLTFMKTIPPYWESFKPMLYEQVGHPEKDKEALKAASPFYNVHKIKAPLFVAQGAKDPRVVQAESDQIVEALRARGVEVPYMLKENEGHGFSNEENRFEFYEAMEKFLGKHLRL